MLRSPEEVGDLNSSMGEVRPHTDPILAHNAKHYRQFVQKLDAVGLLRYTQRPREHVGIFFVWKRGRTAIRMILDARRANRIFRNLPGVCFCSSEALASMEVELPEG
eukprot:2532660-Heterocapsa_arctica.AAC.1